MTSSEALALELSELRVDLLCMAAGALLFKPLALGLPMRGHDPRVGIRVPTVVAARLLARE
jgi:hypothetical protein